MLVSIVLTLISRQSATLPPEQGQSNYAEALKRLREMAPGLATAIHDSNQPAPLVCSGILNRNGRAGESVLIRPGMPCYVRIAGLTEGVSRSLREVLVAHPPAQWGLCRHTFEVVDATDDSRRHVWAGAATYEELLVRNNERHDRQPAMYSQLTLDFSGPVTFSSGIRKVPVPLPDLVFGSLADRWNTYAPEPSRLDLDVRRIANESVSISDYTLETRKVSIKGGNFHVGGVGQVTYNVLIRDLYWMAVLATLCDYALFAGVGAHTAIGMGQARWLK